MNVYTGYAGKPIFDGRFSMSKMFTFNGRRMITWNPFTGCGFNCSYCWARKLALGRLKDTPRYRENGFNPAYHPLELKKKFKSGEFVFVSSMGDIAFCNIDYMRQILEVITAHPSVNFLLQTKSPGQFNTRGNPPPNVYLGTTLETNWDLPFFGNAPMRHERYGAMLNLIHPHKFLSIEPIMDFDLDTFTSWIERIQPEIIEVGADNYHCGLPEPTPKKLEHLLKYLRDICPTVIEKDGLERLR